ncbi:hypothetical protein GGH12_002076 [Coemansia sp. RSA 1822]|nr:hypothetical protein LPJ76_000964 [Coemansia sp. RSA 638]KAJ2123313.1 hypothetical protein IW147_002683 [Coemansia sp. RSA 720]KAJ2564319.1 hypothetical protein GGH12_002076 [Coemansia sp. RSA 1822]
MATSDFDTTPEPFGETASYDSHKQDITGDSLDEPQKQVASDIQPDTNERFVEHAVQRNGSWLGAIMNIMCISIGTGTMNLPKVVSRVGWFGIILFMLMAVIGWYVGVLFRRAMYATPGRRVSSFALVTKAAFGKFGFWFATAITYLYCCGTALSWIIVCGTQISRLIGFAGGHLDEKISMTIIAVVMWVPFTALKTLREITVSSMFGVLTAFFTVLVLAVTSLQHRYTDSYHAPEFDGAPKHEFIIGKGIPSAIASISFMYAGSVAFPHVEGNMRKPQQFGWMLFAANTLVCGAYLLSSVTGYVAFGDQTVSPILNNLPNLAIVNAATIVIVVHCVFALPVMLVSASLELELALGVMPGILGKKKELMWRVIMRTVTMGVLLGIAIAIPYFGQVIDLVSAISTTVVFFMVPVFCYVKLLGWNKIPKYELALCGVLAAIGAVACVWGLIDAIKSLETAVELGHG